MEPVLTVQSRQLQTKQKKIFCKGIFKPYKIWGNLGEGFKFSEEIFTLEQLQLHKKFDHQTF